MDTTSLQSFYEAAAGVAGALIGLLFVAVSVARDRPGEPAFDRHQVPAAAALTSFTNALTVSLVGLIEHGQVSNVAGGCGIAGLLFVGASLTFMQRRHMFNGRDLFMLALMGAVFIAQILVGFSHSSDSGALGAQHAIAIIIVISFLSGITRAWELTGARRLELSHELTSLARDRIRPEAEDAPAGSGSPTEHDAPERHATERSVERSVHWAPVAKSSSTTPARRVRYRP